MQNLRNADRARLNKLADDMLNEARAAESPRIFAATGFSNENISILHQQMRCVNLAWALKFSGKLKSGDVVGVIGGSISGLMLAAALAMCNDVVVYIFEKEKRLLHRFLDKSHRFIGPNLNPRSLKKGYDPTYGKSFYDPPIFKWSAGAVSEVAGEWLKEFRLIAAKLPIFCFFETEIASESAKTSKRGVDIRRENADGSFSTQFKLNWLIDATGFGPESNPLKLADFSYWESGHRLIYDHLPPKARVLISGCGDSGLIELMHYALKDFRHEQIGRFWPGARYLDISIDESLERASLDAVSTCQYGDLEEIPLIGELCWFYGLCRNASGGYHPHPDKLDRVQKNIFQAMEAAVLKTTRRRSQRRRQDCWQRYLNIVEGLTIRQQQAVREAVKPLIDDIASIELKKVISDIDLSKVFHLKRLHKMARPGVSVVLNGVTKTPFTHQLSPYNVWLMHVMLSFPNVRYQAGKLKSAARLANGKYRVSFSDGRVATFNRVVTRYGPARYPRPLFTRRNNNQEMSRLLTSPEILKANGSNSHCFDLAKLEIQNASKRHLKRQSMRAPSVNKDLYVMALTMPVKSRKLLAVKRQLHEAVRTGTRTRFDPQRGV